MFSPSSISFKNGQWRTFSYERLKDNFSEKSWSQIFSSVDSDDQFRQIINLCPETTSCYVLYKNDIFTGAFVFLIKDVDKDNVLSIHGGGESFIDKRFLFRAYIEMIFAILGDGYRVQTTYSENNYKAAKFNSVVGFKTYKNENGRVHLEIDDKGLINSSMYKYLYSTK